MGGALPDDFCCATESDGGEMPAPLRGPAAAAAAAAANCGLAARSMGGEPGSRICNDSLILVSCDSFFGSALVVVVVIVVVVVVVVLVALGADLEDPN
jgi:hypothetical protein